MMDPDARTRWIARRGSCKLRNRDTVTVSPPTFDRTAFARTDAALTAPHAPFDRDWLMARFAEGLEIRMLKPPCEGLVMFQPGRLAWRPIEGAENAVVIHDLRGRRRPLGTGKRGAALGRGGQFRDILRLCRGAGGCLARARA